MIKLGVLGCGNMGGAILRGLAAGGCSAMLELSAFSRSPERCAVKGVEVQSSVVGLVRSADLIVLALKPHQIPPLLRQIASDLKPDKVLISIAAGLTLDVLREASGGKCPVARVMPNTPAKVGQGIFGLCLDDPALSQTAKDAVEKVFSALGRVIVLPESRFNAFSALAGCGPGYVFYLLDALAEAGVNLGFTRREAEEIVLDLFKGSIALKEQSGQNLSSLREEVCSPGGMTIKGIIHLDRTATRGNIVDAVMAAFEQGQLMSKS